MARPINADSAATMDAILEAARAICARGEPVTLRAVARRARVSTGTLRYYFPTRAELIFSAAAGTLDAARSICLRALSALERGARVQDVLRSVDTQLGPFLEEHRMVTVLLHQATTEDPIGPSSTEPKLGALSRWGVDLVTSASVRLARELGWSTEDTAIALCFWFAVAVRLRLLPDEELVELSGHQVAEARALRDDVLASLVGDVFDRRAHIIERKRPPLSVVDDPPEQPEERLVHHARAMVLRGEPLGLRGLARAADMSVSGVRHYFPSVEALHQRVLAVQEEAFVHLIGRALRRRNGGDPPDACIAGLVSEAYTMALEELAINQLRHKETYDNEMVAVLRPSLRQAHGTVSLFAQLMGADPGRFAIAARAVGFGISHVALARDWDVLGTPAMGAPVLAAIANRMLRTYPRRIADAEAG